MSATQEQIERLTKLKDGECEVYLLKADATALDALLREREEPCNGSCDISLARRQIGPDGVVPGNSRECAELWEAEASRLKLEVDEVRELCGPGGDGTARGRVESVLSRLAEAQREIERLAQCIRERDAARSAAVGDQRGHWCSAHGVYCAALSAKAELEAQLQAEREMLDRDRQLAAAQRKITDLVALMNESAAAAKEAEQQLATAAADLERAREALRRLVLYVYGSEDAKAGIDSTALFEQASAALALLAEPADKKGEGNTNGR